MRLCSIHGDGDGGFRVYVIVVGELEIGRKIGVNLGSLGYIYIYI